VLSLKGNQSTLHTEVEDVFTTARAGAFAGIVQDDTEETDTDHGRLEVRRDWVTDELSTLSMAMRWRALRSIGMVERECQIGDWRTAERRVFINSIPADAKRFAHAVRGHWGIENRLHWRLDVVFDDDASRIRKRCRCRPEWVARRARAATLSKRPRSAPPWRGCRSPDSSDSHATPFLFCSIPSVVRRRSASSDVAAQSAGDAAFLTHGSPWGAGGGSANAVNASILRSSGQPWIDPARVIDPPPGRRPKRLPRSPHANEGQVARVSRESQSAGAEA
jgi:hypothetical protein